MFAALAPPPEDCCTDSRCTRSITKTFLKELEKLHPSLYTNYANNHCEKISQTLTVYFKNLSLVRYYFLISRFLDLHESLVTQNDSLSVGQVFISPRTFITHRYMIYLFFGGFLLKSHHLVILYVANLDFNVIMGFCHKIIWWFNKDGRAKLSPPPTPPLLFCLRSNNIEIIEPSLKKLKFKNCRGGGGVFVWCKAQRRW